MELCGIEVKYRLKYAICWISCGYTELHLEYRHFFQSKPNGEGELNALQSLYHKAINGT